MFTDEQKAALVAKLDPTNIRERSQAGRKFSYIEAWQATAECNEVFGFDGWDHETVDLRLVNERERPVGNDKGWGVSYVAKVRITVRAGDTAVVREGVGAGHGIDRDLGQAHESAVKEAESDAFKRAAKSFGWRFGLALYDKDKEHVASASPEPAPYRPSTEAIALEAQILGMNTEVSLSEWGRDNAGAMKGLSPDDYRHVRAAYGMRLERLKAMKVAAE